MSKVVLKAGDLLIVSPDRFDPFVATLVETSYRGAKYPNDLSPCVLTMVWGLTP